MFEFVEKIFGKTRKEVYENARKKEYDKRKSTLYKPLTKVVKDLRLKEGYRIFGIDESSSKEDIKSNFRRLAKKYHPDHNKNNNATDQFEKLKLWYDYLLANHVQKVVFKGIKLFRVLSQVSKNEYLIEIPRGSTEIDDVKIIFMIGSKEYSIVVIKGSKVPLTFHGCGLNVRIVEYNTW